MTATAAGMAKDRTVGSDEGVLLESSPNRAHRVAMTVRQLLIFALIIFVCPVWAQTWKATSDSGRTETDPNVTYLRRTIRDASGKTATLHLVFFSSLDCKLEVIDLGAGSPGYSSNSAAFKARGCVAGINGGFFGEDFRPLGLMIADGKRTGSFSKGGFLTSGVIASNPKGIDLLRRNAYRSSPNDDALLQSGPYLVENAAPVKGLDDTKARKRSVILTDWRRNWAIASTSSLTLAEVAEVFASPDVITEWKVNRALNLDGGTSCGFFFDKPGDAADVNIVPWKSVRNLLGVAPR